VSKKNSISLITCLVCVSVLIEAKNYKVGIVHYRVGKTDGVSLEIEKRKQVLEKMGCEVVLISGPVQHGADFILDELEFENPKIKEIKENSFAYFEKNTITPEKLLRKINHIAHTIEKKFLDYFYKQEFDLLLIHNVFSLGLHLPAAQAFYNIARKTGIPIIATHHDYYWERERFKKPANNLIIRFLSKYIPPCLENVTHVCINSLAQNDLVEKRGIDSYVLPDVFDFEQSLWKKDSYNIDFYKRIGVKENDIIVLQATRIVERKGIELAIQFVKELNINKHRLIGKKLYNGKIVTKESDIVLVFAGYPENFALPYLQKLKMEITNTQIQARFIYDMIDAQRLYNKITGKKIYSLWDAYVFADIVTYPSLWEGWGNQFIEAIFAKKPIVVFEYPVFTVDIKKEGYSVISLGSIITGKKVQGLVQVSQEKLESACTQAIEILISKSTPKILENNFSLGQQYHGYHVLEKFLGRQLNKLFSNKVRFQLLFQV